MTKFRQVLFKSMTIGKKIRQLREEAGLKQRELASQLKIGEGYLSKVENDQKQLKREDLTILSKIFKYPISDLETLWLASKVYCIVRGENVGLEALKVAEEQVEYQKRKDNE